MIFRKLGRTNLAISSVSIGGGVFNPNKDPNLTINEANEVISYCVDNGVNLIDTGKEYDENFISEAMGSNKENLHIVTKSEARNKEEMMEDIQDSLDKLGVNKIDVYQMHMVQSVQDLKNRIDNGVFEALREAQSNDIIGFTGIFSHRIDVLIEAVKMNKFDVVTVLYNAGHTLAEKLFKYTNEHNNGVFVAAPLGNGILVDPNIEGEESNLGAENMTAQRALKFVLSNKSISSALVGSRNLKHAKENIKIGDKNWKLSEIERKKITKKIEEFLGQNFCRGCRYCEPCTEFDGELPISDILKLKILFEGYGYENFARFQFSLKQKAQNIKKCIGCGECESKCPYDISIAEELKEADRLLRK